MRRRISPGRASGASIHPLGSIRRRSRPESVGAAPATKLDLTQSTKAARFVGIRIRGDAIDAPRSVSCESRPARSPRAKKNEHRIVRDDRSRYRAGIRRPGAQRAKKVTLAAPLRKWPENRVAAALNPRSSRAKSRFTAMKAGQKMESLVL